MWETFWNSSFWLGGRWTWEDFEDKKDGVRHPHLDDLYMSLPLTGLLILFKTLIQRSIFLPIGVWYGMENRAIGPSHDPTSKKALVDSERLDGKQVLGHVNESNGSQIRLENRLPMSSNPINVLDKFTNLGWKFVYKSLFVTFEIYYLWNKEWLWNIDQCWHGYPHQEVDNSLKWFFCCQLAYFMAEMLLQINDPIRKNLLIMIIHHVCAVNLVSMTWIINLARIFALSIFAHDVGDVFLQIERLLFYMKHFVVTKYFFPLMFIAWISTRVVFFSQIILSYKIFLGEFGLQGAYYFVFGFSSTLLCLNVIWTIPISKCMWRIVTTGRVEKSKSAY